MRMNVEEAMTADRNEEGEPHGSEPMVVWGTIVLTVTAISLYVLHVVGKLEW